MIDRYNVWVGPFALRHLADQILRDTFVARPAERSAPQGGAMDVYEEGDNLVVKIQMPGVTPEDVDVTLHQGLLTVRGKTTSEDERKERSYVVREHRTGSFMRQFRVSESLDADEVHATFEHGVLRLTLPKDARDRGHRIPITTGSTAAIEPATSPTPTEVQNETATVGADAGPAASAEAAALADAPAKSRSRASKMAGDEAPRGKATGRGPTSRKPRSRKAAPTPA